LETKIANLKSTISDTKTDYADNSTKMNEMLEEIKTHMAASKSAQEAYERELTLHSEARSSLREARDTMDGERRLRQTAETEVASLKAEFDGNKSVWKDEKGKLLASIKTVEQMLKVSKGENQLLHSQVATLSDASKRLESGAGPSGDAESSTAKNLAEMREIVNFMKTERVLVENRLEVVEQELECERASGSVAKRSLDEARGELKRMEEAAAAEKQVGGGDHANLMEQVQQLNLLRESNVMLRDDNVRVTKKVTDLEKEKQKALAAIEPLEKKLNDSQAKAGSLEADKTALTKEVGNWKERVKSMTSKFHQIDPTEHTEALAKAETLAKESASAKQLLTRTRQEFGKAKNLVEKLKKEKEVLSTEKDSLAKKLKAGAGEGGKMKELTEKLAGKETELKGSNDRLEKFREILRKMKSDSGAKVKRIEELEGEVARLKAGGGGVGGGGKKGGKGKEKEDGAGVGVGMGAEGGEETSNVSEEVAMREKALAKMKQSKADKAAKLAKLKEKEKEKEKLGRSSIYILIVTRVCVCVCVCLCVGLKFIAEIRKGISNFGLFW